MILWSFYRMYFKTDMPVWFDEFLAKPVIFILPIYYYINHYEKKDFLKSVDLKIKDWKRSIIFGLFIGIFFFLLGVFTKLIQPNGLVSLIKILFSTSTIYYFLIALATSFSEEIVSRGFILKRIYEDKKNLLLSIFYASILLVFLHIPIIFTNPDLHGIVIIQMIVMDFIFSLAVSLLYLQTKSLYVPIIVHTFYIFSVYLFLLPS